MIDYCISSFLKRQDEKIYRMYVTDSLKLVVENTANFAGGSTINARYSDLIDKNKVSAGGSEEETLEASEIVDNIVNKLLKLGN